MSEASPISEDDWKSLGLRAGTVFRPSAPVDEEDLFAGRTYQMRRVVDAINQPGRHAVIFGERGVGKTSLANVLAKHLVNPGMTLAAPRINCDSADEYASIWRKIFGRIQVLSLNRQMGFGKELEKIEGAELLAHVPDEVTTEDVRKVLAQLAEVSVLVVIVDEFDRVVSSTAKRLIADTIKMLSDQDIGATLVLVGVADSVEDLIAQHESTERAIVQIQMPRMSREELHEILEKCLGRLGMAIDDDARNLISFLSQGLPTYTHLLGRHAARNAIDARTLNISIPHVEDAIKEALQDAEQSVRSLYDRAVASPRGETLYPQVLLACALAETGELGYFAAGDIRTPLQLVTGRSIDIPGFAKHLKEFSGPIRGPVLQRMGEKHRIRYRFAKPLIQPFVIMKGLAEGRITRAHLEKLSPWDAPRLI